MAKSKTRHRYRYLMAACVSLVFALIGLGLGLFVSQIDGLAPQAADMLRNTAIGITGLCLAYGCFLFWLYKRKPV